MNASGGADRSGTGYRTVHPLGWGGDSAKWLINRFGVRWFVMPPLGARWGRATHHATFEQARTDFVRQTTRVRADD